MVAAVFSLRFVFLLAAVRSAAPGLTVSAVIGEDATLPCETGKYMPFKVLEWSRPGTKREYVLIFKTQSSHIEVPTPSYKGRVKLETTENGDMSLILKNVTFEDEGKYECYVLRKTKRRKRANLESVNTVYLDVLPPGNKDEEETLGNIRGYVPAVVAACCLLAVMVSLMAAVAVIRRKKIKDYRSFAQDEAEKPQIV